MSEYRDNLSRILLLPTGDGTNVVKAKKFKSVYIFFTGSCRSP